MKATDKAELKRIVSMYGGRDILNTLASEFEDLANGLDDNAEVTWDGTIMASKEDLQNVAANLRDSMF
jgi:hypothetical protein